MVDPIELNTLLVPTDFSPASAAAFQQAVRLAGGEKPVVILLHVVDPSLAEFAANHALCSSEEAIQRMRERAQQQLDEMAAQVVDGVEVDCLVSEGVPFLEILAKSADFAVDAIVMGKVGMRGRVEKLLFGSTAEKVLRGSSRPVLVLPFNPRPNG